MSEDAQATTHLFRFNTETRTEETAASTPSFRQAAHLSAGGIARTPCPSPRNGEVATIRSTFSDPPEIFVGQPAHLQPDHACE